MNELTTEIRLVVPNENSEISAVQPNRDRQMSHPLPRFVVETPKASLRVQVPIELCRETRSDGIARQKPDLLLRSGTHRDDWQTTVRQTSQVIEACRNTPAREEE